MILVKDQDQSWLDNVLCTGSESTLASCGHLGVGITSCNHSKDAGVVCSTDRVKGILKVEKDVNISTIQSKINNEKRVSTFPIG